jgi:glycosyltransferase involved in cell wall biosynthesis
MRIVLVYQHFIVSGVGSTKPYDLARHLVATGHDVTVICGKGYLSQGMKVPKGLLVRLNIEGIKLAVLGVDYRQQMSFAQRILSFLTFTFGAMLLVCFMRRYDVLVASSTPLTVGLAGLVSRYIRGRPWIFEVRDMWPEYPVVAGYLKNKFVIWLSTFFEEWFYRSASAVSVIGSRMRDTLIRRGFPAEKIVFIPTAVSLDEFKAVEPDRAWRAEHGLEGQTVAVYTGSHGPSNGLQYVLEAAESLKNNPGYKFVLLGAGSDKPRLMAEAEQRGLKNVLFLPPVPRSRIPGILKACDATLLIYEITPATGYDMPNKFFEYLAAGLPMITNDEAELWDHVKEFDCGILVDPDRPEELADALRTLKSDLERARQMGRQALELVRTRFDRKRLHKTGEDLLWQVAACGRAGRPGEPPRGPAR